MRARLLLALAASSLLAVPVVASAAGSTVSFTSVQVSQKNTKNGFVIKDNDFKGTTKVGTDTLTCTFVSQTKINCGLKVTRPNGTIRGTLSVGAAAQGPITVTGGTGAYKGATGTGTFRNLDKAGTRTAVVLRLR